MILFDSFLNWGQHSLDNNIPLYQDVVDFEMERKGVTREEIMDRLKLTYNVMKEAVNTGLTQDMTSTSGLINNGAKKVFNTSKVVLNKDFQYLIARALAAKEVNSCMGRIVAAPTAGASGILPGTLVTLQEIHKISDEKIYEALLIAAGVALVLEKRASISGAVGGCQAETGSAAAMAASAIVYCLGGDIDQIFASVAITIQCMLGLICDPVAGLVEIPCVVRNASAASIAYSSAQIALAGVLSVIPVDECVDVMGEIGLNMDTKYKETALGGLADTPTGRKIAREVLKNKIEEMEDHQSEIND